MHKKLFFFLLLACVGGAARAQFAHVLKDIKPPKDFQGTHTQTVYTDPFCSSFLIWTKNGVEAHVHKVHTEQIYILEGKGQMQVGMDMIDLYPGVYVTIPPNVIHHVKVKGKKPLKALSIQAPEFLGDDRELR